MIVTPALQTMIGRLILALMIVGAFISLGMWANSGPAALFTWLATVATATVALLASGSLRSISTARLGAGRFADTLAIIREHPLFRVLATDAVARGITAFAFGVLVATAESAVGGSVFAGVGDAFARGALSLLLVGTVAWTIVALITVPDPVGGFWTRLGATLAAALGLEAREVGRWGRAILAGLLRALVTVIFRVVVLLTLPPIFANPFAIAFFALVALTVITAGDSLLEIARKLREGSHTPAGQEGRLVGGTGLEEDAR